MMEYLAQRCPLTTLSRRKLFGPVAKRLNTEIGVNRSAGILWTIGIIRRS